MEIRVNCLSEKHKWLEWLYIAMFALGLLISVPFIALALVSEICIFFGKSWIEWLKKILNIEFEL